MKGPLIFKPRSFIEPSPNSTHYYNREYSAGDDYDTITTKDTTQVIIIRRSPEEKQHE
jgi:hypothetical protein